MRSESTGRVVPKTCKSWLCAGCNVWLSEGARRALLIGAMTCPDGSGLGFLTLTDTAAGDMDLPALKSRLERTVKALRRRNWLGEYAASIEFQKRGALHPHLLCHVPLEVLPLWRPHGEKKRNREQYAWHFKELVPLVKQLGWGRMVDAEQVTSAEGASFYAAKSLAGYATKEAHQKFKAAGAKRVRPLRMSAGWIPERLRDVQRGNLATDEGPWVDVSAVIC
jgi:hypothetical protein